MKNNMIITSLGLICLLISTLSYSQQGVCVYKDSNFEGPRRCFQQDIYDFNEIGINDEISSFKIHGNVDVIFYEHGNFRGAKKHFTHSQKKLKNGMNDNFSAMKIKPTRRDSDWGDRGDWGNKLSQDNIKAEDNDWSKNDKSDDNLFLSKNHQGKVCLYPDWNYLGKALCFNHDVERLSRYNFDNKADSIKVYGDIEVIMYQHENFKGYRRVFKSDNKQFLGDDHDSYSSLRIRRRR